MNTMTETALRGYRLEMKPRVSKEKVAHEAHITLQTYQNAENGGNCSYSTAKSIFAAINILRNEKGLKRVKSIDDLGLNIV